MSNYWQKLSQNISPGLQKIFKNFSWLLAERLLNMLLALTIGIYMIRYLGAQQFGLLSFAFSFVNIFDGLSRFGLDSLVIRNLVSDETKTPPILGSSFLLKALIILGCIVISISLFQQINQDVISQQIMLIIAFSLVFNAFDVIDFWFQSRLLSQPMVLVRGTQVILSAGLKLVFIHHGLSVMAFAYLYLVEGLTRMVGMLIAYHQYRQSWQSWRWDWAIAKELLQDAWPLALSSMMVIIYIRIDQVMLGMLSTDEAVGVYSAAIRFSEIWYFIPVIICSSVFPAIVRAKTQNAEDYYERLQQLYDFLTWGALLLALLVSWVAYPLVYVLLGPSYHASAPILVVHIWALPFVFLGVGRNQWLIAENLNPLSFWTTTLGALSNILLNWLLIPSQAGLGAAIATVISYGIAAYLSCFLYPPLYPMGKMLTKALLIPFRWRQNYYYWLQIKKVLPTR